MAWFKQEAALSGAYLPDGRKIPLDFILDTQDGFIATDNGYVVNQIRAAINSRSGGWVEVTSADYDEALKKKAQPPSAAQKRRASHLNAGMFRNPLENPVASAVVAEKPDPIAVPKPEEMKLPARPKVGKLVTK